MSEADRAFQRGEYAESAAMYRKILRKTSTQNKTLRREASFKMAEAYRLLNMPERAIAGYAGGMRYGADSLMSLQYARVLHKTRNYRQAKEQYEIFLRSFPDNRFAQNGLQSCDSSLVWLNNPTRHLVRKMDLFTSPRGEFSPVFGGGDYNVLYFSSNRKEAKGEERSRITGFKNNDFFLARRNSEGQWQKPEKIEGKINTDYDEGAASISATGDKMYYTFCAADSVKPSNAGVYMSMRADGNWGEGTPLILTRDSTAMAAHPAISPSGDYLYFVSDMAGGRGGKDIWRVRLVAGQPDYVENLGAEINTGGNEMFPYMRNDTTLYFSSDGHIGMGGLDIFKAVFRSKTGKWEVENMKSPVNSNADDFGIAFEGAAERGFFSSNRNEARGLDHIYQFERKGVTITLEGYIVDKDEEFVPNAIISVVGNNGVNTYVQGRSDGTYRLQVQQGTDYVLLAKADGFLNTRMELKTANIEKDTLYYVDFVLPAMHKPVVLEHIFYDFAKSSLRPESQKELDELVNVLNLNPNVTIELSAHTDRVGTDEYNNGLSLRRAESVVNYLLTKGIQKERVQAKGYGKTEPHTITKALAKQYPFLPEGTVLTEQFIQTLPAEQQSVCDQINRRTQFKVLNVNYRLQ